MPPNFKIGFEKVRGKTPSAELGKVSLYGDKRYCVRHIVSTEGIAADKLKVELISSLSSPKSGKDV